MQSSSLAGSSTSTPLAAHIANNANLCTEVSFISQLLSYGFDLPDHTALRIAKRIGGMETGWSLGAALSVLSSVTAPSCSH